MRMPCLPRRPSRSLVFSPLAFLKLQYLCHQGPTEVGAFGISAVERPLYIENLMTVRQSTSAMHVDFDDGAVADYYDTCVDQGLKPAQFARMWFHTHPGRSAMPSGTDEETFRRAFQHADWAVMAIVSRAGHTYARLQVNAGPGASCRLGWTVDWKAWPDELQRGKLEHLYQLWSQEYARNVQPEPDELIDLPPDPSRTLPWLMDHAWNSTGVLDHVYIP